MHAQPKVGAADDRIGSRTGVVGAASPHLLIPRELKVEERTRNDASVVLSAFPVHCSVPIRQPGAKTGTDGANIHRTNLSKSCAV
jgi:hypothetical protein